jgi:hypothetical protein
MSLFVKNTTYMNATNNMKTDWAHRCYGGVRLYHYNIPWVSMANYTKGLSGGLSGTAEKNPVRFAALASFHYFERTV